MKPCVLVTDDIWCSVEINDDDIIVDVIVRGKTPIDDDDIYSMIPFDTDIPPQSILQAAMMIFRVLMNIIITLTREWY